MLPCLCDRSPHTLLGSKVPTEGKATRWKRTCLVVAFRSFSAGSPAQPFRMREAKRKASEESAHNHIFRCKSICNMFLSRLHMGCIISQHLTLKCIINSASKLSASLTSCAQDCNLDEGQQLLTRLCTFFLWLACAAVENVYSRRLLLACLSRSLFLTLSFLPCTSPCSSSAGHCPWRFVKMSAALPV